MGTTQRRRITVEKSRERLGFFLSWFAWSAIVWGGVYSLLATRRGRDDIAQLAVPSFVALTMLLVGAMVQRGRRLVLFLWLLASTLLWTGVFAHLMDRLWLDDYAGWAMVAFGVQVPLLVAALGRGGPQMRTLAMQLALIAGASQAGTISMVLFKSHITLDNMLEWLTAAGAIVLVIDSLAWWGLLSIRALRERPRRQMLAALVTPIACSLLTLIFVAVATPGGALWLHAMLVIGIALVPLVVVLGEMLNARTQGPGKRSMGRTPTERHHKEEGAPPPA